MRTWQRVLVTALVALGSVAGVVAGFRALGEGDAVTPSGEPVTARATLLPRETHFGDTVTATLALTVDPARVDPGSVRVSASFDPFRIVGRPVQRRTDADGRTALVIAYSLLCLTDRCTPRGSVLREELPPATVTYAARSGGESAASLLVPWPGIVVHTRLDPATAADTLGPGGQFTNASPWRADLESVPAVGYRVSPGWTRWALLGASALLALLAAGLVYLALPRWEPAPEPEPEPEPEPDALPPLEQALEVLESPVDTNGSSGRRRALELVADAVAEWDDGRLAAVARTLAWSEGAPTPTQTRSLAARVRAHLEETASVQPPEANGGPA